MIAFNDEIARKSTPAKVVMSYFGLLSSSAIVSRNVKLCMAEKYLYISSVDSCSSTIKDTAQIEGVT